MTKRHLLLLSGAILLWVAIVVALSERNTLSGLQRENEKMLAQGAEIEELLLQNSQLPKLREQNQVVQQLREGNRDLFKLRNAIGKLRIQKIEFERLRAENEQLAGIKKSASPHPHPEPLPGYIPKTAFLNAGKTTPEAGLQTMFWAIFQPDAKEFSDCLAENEQEAEATKNEYQDFFKGFTGYAVVDKKLISEKEVILQIQTSAKGPKLPVRMREVSSDWKFLSFREPTRSR